VAAIPAIRPRSGRAAPTCASSPRSWFPHESGSGFRSWTVADDAQDSFDLSVSGPFDGRCWIWSPEEASTAAVSFQRADLAAFGLDLVDATD
jgi:hypothetical protein